MSSEVQSRPQVDGEDREGLAQSLAQAYLEGATIRSLAKARGLPYRTVRELLGEQLVQEAKRTGASRAPRLEQSYRPRVKGAERVRLARSLARAYLGGATIRSLAEERDMSYGTVRQMLREAKVPLRGRGGRVARG